MQAYVNIKETKLVFGVAAVRENLLTGLNMQQNAMYHSNLCNLFFAAAVKFAGEI